MPLQRTAKQLMTSSKLPFTCHKCKLSSDDWLLHLSLLWIIIIVQKYTLYIYKTKNKTPQCLCYTSNFPTVCQRIFWNEFLNFLFNLISKWWNSPFRINKVIWQISRQIAVKCHEFDLLFINSKKTKADISAAHGDRIIKHPAGCLSRKLWRMCCFQSSHSGGKDAQDKSVRKAYWLVE